MVTAQQFILRIQNYYGRYPDGQLPLVQKYVGRFDGVFLDVLFADVVKAFPSQYKSPPDIAVMEPIVTEIYSARSQGKYLPPTPALQIEDQGYLPKDEAAKKLGTILGLLLEGKSVKNR